jgi:hypothetical protein
MESFFIDSEALLSSSPSTSVTSLSSLDLNDVALHGYTFSNQPMVHVGLER